VRNPAPAKRERGLVTSGGPSQAGPKSTRKWLYKNYKRLNYKRLKQWPMNDSDGFVHEHCKTKKKVTLIKKYATVAFLKLIMSQFD